MEDSHEPENHVILTEWTSLDTFIINDELVHNFDSSYKYKYTAKTKKGHTVIMTYWGGYNDNKNSGNNVIIIGV